MHKRKLHHLWVIVRSYSYWYLIAAFIVSALISVLALRQNNINALNLRDKVIAADEANGDVEGALRELRKYVHGHMNTSLSSETGIYPPIQLKYRYERLVAEEKQKVSVENEKIYSDAQAVCERRFPQGLSGSGRIPCIQDYVDSRGVKAQPIPDALYKFDFASPMWSPDFAGWSLVVTFVLGLVVAVRFAAEWWLRSRLDI